MKRFLSIFLAVTMILAMLPTAFAAVDEATGAITYEFFAPGTETIVLEDRDGIKNAEYTEYDSANGRDWAYLGTNWTTTTKIMISMRPGENGYLNCGANNPRNSWIAFKIKVPVSATYTVSGTAYHYANGSAAMGVYIAPMNDKFSAGTTIYGTVSDGERTGATTFGTNLGIDPEADLIATVNIRDSESVVVRSISWPDDSNSVYMKAGEDYLLIFNQGQNKNKGLTPTSITLTPVSEETTDEPEEVTESISFVATSNVGKVDMMSVEGFTYEKFTDSIPAGTYVTVTPKEYTGYEFKHWVRGSADNGVYVSDNPAYSFTALTHTFLTAIYENVSNEGDNTATVEFYNGNGQYLDKAVSTVGGTVSVPDKAKAPAMTGFEFANQWRTEDGVFDASAPLAKKLTRAVAQFNTPSTTFTVTCGDKEKQLTYGSKHTFTSNNPVYWTREGAVVGYGTSYTHAAWDTTEITTSETGELVPVVLLDDTKKDGAYMIEYNAAGKEILEVGIVFGGEGVNIRSCSSKATSQYKNQHGQFTARPYGTETYARGYMIYEDTDGSYKVIYSD